MENLKMSEQCKMDGCSQELDEKYESGPYCIRCEELLFDAKVESQERQHEEELMEMEVVM